jgi:ubiquinone/menaquinone biosynthesis C-methylase UbiE
MDAIHNKLLIQHDLKKTLELGCGPGTYTTSLVKQADHVTATDFSDEMIKAAKSKLDHLEKITVEKANCFQLHYKDKLFDTVFIANLLHVVPNPEKVVAEAQRVLKPNGKIIVVSFTSEGMSFFNKLRMFYKYLRVWGKPPSGGQVLTVKKTADMLSQSGFIIEEAKLIGNKSKAIFVTAKTTG